MSTRTRSGTAKKPGKRTTGKQPGAAKRPDDSTPARTAKAARTGKAPGTAPPSGTGGAAGEGQAAAAKSRAGAREEARRGARAEAREVNGGKPREKPRGEARNGPPGRARQRLRGVRAFVLRTGPRSSPHGPVSHVKVALATVAWVALIREQALLLAAWQEFYYQALVASAGLLVCSVAVVYLYPPRTTRWRTLAWTFLSSSVGGALTYAVLGGRAGVLGSLVVGGLTLWARSGESARRAVRRLRARRGRQPEQPAGSRPGGRTRNRNGDRSQDHGGRDGKLATEQSAKRTAEPGPRGRS